MVRETRHLFLDLPALSPALQAYIDAASAAGGWSQNCVQVTAAWMRDGLKFRCITRDLKWGTPVPAPGYEEKARRGAARFRRPLSPPAFAAAAALPLSLPSRVPLSASSRPQNPKTQSSPGPPRLSTPLNPSQPLSTPLNTSHPPKTQQTRRNSPPNSRTRRSSTSGSTRPSATSPSPPATRPPGRPGGAAPRTWSWCRRAAARGGAGRALGGAAPRTELALTLKPYP